MTAERPGVFRRVAETILNIGADPSDDGYTRIIKRMWWPASAAVVLASLGSTLLYFGQGDRVMGWLFFFSSLLFLGLLLAGARHPRHFRAITVIVPIYFVSASLLATVLRGGPASTDGTVMIGLMGPLMGLVYFSDRRLAVALFVAYGAAVMVLAALAASPERTAGSPVASSPLVFWLGFVIVAAFIVGVAYFFVVQRDRAHRELAEEKARSASLLQRIESDLKQAARIQRDLLPKSNPRLEGYDISGANVPCYEIGGDYYDFIPIDADRLAIVIADVSGKGISASLLMASLRAALLPEVRPDYALDRMVSRLSDFVYTSSGPTSFVTFVFAELDVPTGVLRYINAGHNPPFILGRVGPMRTLEATGFPLGMFAGSVYETRTITLGPGELAVLYTDGIPDGRSPQGEDYSETRLVTTVRDNLSSPAAAICRKVLGDVDGFACGTQFCDDMTLIVVKRREAAPAGAPI